MPAWCEPWNATSELDASAVVRSAAFDEPPPRSHPVNPATAPTAASLPAAPSTSRRECDFTSTLYDERRDLRQHVGQRVDLRGERTGVGLRQVGVEHVA